MLNVSLKNVILLYVFVIKVYVYHVSAEVEKWFQIQLNVRSVAMIYVLNVCKTILNVLHVKTVIVMMKLRKHVPHAVQVDVLNMKKQMQITDDY